MKAPEVKTSNSTEPAVVALVQAPVTTATPEAKEMKYAPSTFAKADAEDRSGVSGEVPSAPAAKLPKSASNQSELMMLGGLLLGFGSLRSVRSVHECDNSVAPKNLFLVTERYLGSAVAALGALILALAATAVLEGWFYQWSGHRQLNATPLFGQRVHAAGKKSDTSVNPRPTRGMFLAKLQVPRLNMSVVVLGFR